MSNKKTTSVETGEEPKERKPIMFGNAQVSLVEYTYNTTDEKILEMTRLSPRQAFHMVQKLTFGIAAKHAADLANYHKYLRQKKALDTYPERLKAYEAYVKEYEKWDKDHAIAKGEPPAEVFDPGKRRSRPKDVWIKAFPFIFRKDLAAWESYYENVRKYEKYLKDYAEWDNKVQPPVQVANPGIKPKNPEFVEKPPVFLLSQKMAILQMRIARSIKSGDGSTSFDKAAALTEIAAQVNVDDSEQGPEYEAP